MKLDKRACRHAANVPLHISLNAGVLYTERVKYLVTAAVKLLGKQSKYSGLSRKSVILQVYYRFTPTLCGADFRPDWLRLGGCKYSKLLQYRRGRGSVW